MVCNIFLTVSQLNMTCNILMLLGFLELDSSLKIVCFSKVGKFSLCARHNSFKAACKKYNFEIKLFSYNT